MKRYLIVCDSGTVVHKDTLENEDLDGFDSGYVLSIIDLEQKLFYVDTSLDGKQIWNEIEEYTSQ